MKRSRTSLSVGLVDVVPLGPRAFIGSGRRHGNQLPDRGHLGEQVPEGCVGHGHLADPAIQVGLDRGFHGRPDQVWLHPVGEPDVLVDVLSCLLVAKPTALRPIGTTW